MAMTATRPQSAFNRHLTASFVEFPLYCEGVERTRFAYGIYLLNKVVPHSLCARYPLCLNSYSGTLVMHQEFVGGYTCLFSSKS